MHCVRKWHSLCLKKRLNSTSEYLCQTSINFNDFLIQKIMNILSLTTCLLHIFLPYSYISMIGLLAGRGFCSIWTTPRFWSWIKIYSNSVFIKRTFGLLGSTSGLRLKSQRKIKRPILSVFSVLGVRQHLWLKLPAFQRTCLSQRRWLNGM